MTEREGALRLRNRTKGQLPAPARLALRWLCFFLLVILTASCSTAPGWDFLSYSLIPLSLAVAVFSEEIPSAILGGLAGLAADVVMDQLAGFTALYLCLASGLISAMFRQLLRKNLIGYMACVVILTAGYLYADYFFYYGIWELEGRLIALEKKLLPSALWAVATAPALFYLIRLTVRLTETKRTLEIEGADDKIDRV